MTEQVKLPTSLNILKKRKTRKELNKLLASRQNRQTRTSSCQDFHKLNNINDDNEFVSSTDDTTTLLNSTDDGLEYFGNSNFMRKDGRKRKACCCNKNHFIVCSCIINVLAIVACCALVACVVINKRSIDDLKLSYDNDLSRHNIEMKSLRYQVSRTKQTIKLDYNNQTILNHTLRIQMLEDKVHEFGKQLIRFHYKNSPVTKPYNDRVLLLTLKNELNTINKNVTQLYYLVNTLTGKINKTDVNSKNNSSFMVNMMKNNIQYILFQPSKEQMDASIENSTAVLLSLTEYKHLLHILKGP